MSTLSYSVLSLDFAADWTWICSQLNYFNFVSFLRRILPAVSLLGRLRAFALEAGRLGSILSQVTPKTLKLVSAVTFAKCSAIEWSAEDEMKRE